MTEPSNDKVDLYLFRLEKALAMPPERTAEVVAEVRGNLEEHVERGVAAGLSEAEAVAQALAELGPVEDLAVSMREELPPFGGRGVTVLRYVVAAGLMAWTLLLFWTLRAWTYGTDPVVTGLVVCLHLPAILLAWPRIVWRRNWLFGLIPAGVLVLIVLLVVSAGTQSEMELGSIGPSDGTVVFPDQEASQEPPRWRAVLLTATMGVVSIYLLLAMQQRAQRMRVLALVVVALVTLEVPFLWEETRFRKDRDRVAAFLDSGDLAYGKLDAATAKLSNPDAQINLSGEGFLLFWNRPLSGGFAIVYDSERDEVWVND